VIVKKILRDDIRTFCKNSNTQARHCCMRASSGSIVLCSLQRSSFRDKSKYYERHRVSGRTRDIISALRAARCITDDAGARNLPLKAPCFSSDDLSADTRLNIYFSLRSSHLENDIYISTFPRVCCVRARVVK